MSADDYQLLRNGQVVGRWGKGDRLDQYLTDAIAELKDGKPRPPPAAPSQPIEGPMKDKLAALREYNATQRKALSAKIDAVMARAQEVYPRANAAADHQLAEVEGIDEELAALEDEANQAIGGNNPPADGSASSPKSSGV